MRLSRERYAQLYGPTVGDRVRLADTNLLIEVTEDRSGGPVENQRAVDLEKVEVRADLHRPVASIAHG